MDPVDRVGFFYHSLLIVALLPQLRGLRRYLSQFIELEYSDTFG